MISDFLSSYGGSFWNGFICLYLLNYWSETNVDINMQNYLIFVAADLARIYISNPVYQSILGGVGMSSS